MTREEYRDKLIELYSECDKRCRETLLTRGPIALYYECPCCDVGKSIDKLVELGWSLGYEPLY